MGFYSDQTLSYTNEDAELDRRDGPALQALPTPRYITVNPRITAIHEAGRLPMCHTCGDDGDCPDCDFTALAHQYAQTYQISFYAARADIARRRQANGDDEAARWFRRTFAGERLAWSTTA